MRSTVFPPGPENAAYFLMRDPKTNVNMTTWAVYGDLGIDPAGRRPDSPSFYVLPGAKPATDWTSRNADGVHISLHGPKPGKPGWKAHVRGAGSNKMGKSARTGALERAQLAFLGAPVQGHPNAFAPLVIRTTKRSFAGADQTHSVPDTDGRPGFFRASPETDDVAHDLVFLISRDQPLPEKPDNAIPAIFQLPIGDRTWYLHIESQINSLAELPSPKFSDDQMLSFVRQSGTRGRCSGCTSWHPDPSRSRPDSLASVPGASDRRHKL